MLPTLYNDDLTADFTFETNPGKTFYLLPDGDHCEGMCDGLASVKQAVGLILRTERYRWLIHSWDYGVELNGLFGQPVTSVMASAQETITEALLQDDRISSVDGFSTEKKGTHLHLSFTVTCLYGAFTEEVAI